MLQARKERDDLLREPGVEGAMGRGYSAALCLASEGCYGESA